MSRQLLFTLFIGVSLALSAGCVAQPTATTEPARPATATPGANLPNPASVYCEAHGGRVDLRTSADGAVAGVCVFADGSECDEWAYYRGECQPGAAPAVEIAADGCQVYRDHQLGYSLHLPAGATMQPADDPTAGLTLVGPEVKGEHWPMIYLTHPADRADYRPPEGVDLAQWLNDHYLLPLDSAAPAEVRQADVTIAGLPAIHTRLERSPQTYAFDKYYFARAQQLYVIVILHTGDQEDWALYDHFLNNFQFDS